MVYITENRLQHQELRALLLAISVWVLLGHTEYIEHIEGLRHVAYGLSSSSEKTSKSDHLQMSLQRQHFLLSYLKTLRVGPARVLNLQPPAQKPSAQPHLANQSAV